MRMFAVLLVLAAFAGCGDDERAAAPAGPDDPVSAPPREPEPDSGPGTPPRECERLARRLAGLTVPAATEHATLKGCTLRVAVQDGEPQVLTEDFQPGRINVRVTGGVVTRLEFMG
jgi:hypothetical protein